MKITLKAWVIFTLLALAAVAVWITLSYPEFSSLDLSVGKKAAFEEAQQFLKERGVDTKKYSKATVFITDGGADRYLQKAIGFKAEEEFIKAHSYNLFYWAVRFYQENKKEEYTVNISPKTREVISFQHAIEDTESRPTRDKEAARQMAKDFLLNQFKINFADFDFHNEVVRKLDKRTDYSFSWEKKNVNIPWSKAKDSGAAKLLTGATISGEEVSGFTYLQLDIPEKFSRLIENQMSRGELLTSITMFFYLMWIAWAIIIIVRRRNALLMFSSKKFYIIAGVSVFVLGFIGIANSFQQVLFNYNTSTSFKVFLGYYFVNILVNLIFICLTIVLPGIAGESLRYDAFPKKPYTSFFHYLTTSFFNRNLTKSVGLGYLVFLIVLGVQAAIFHFGQKFWGVWVEHTRLTGLSSAYLPFLGAFIVGYKASLNEEIVFRIFGISWAKKYLKNTLLAVIAASLIWGFGHSGYAVFPTWFRGIEVGIMGLVFGFIFLRYGVVCLIVAHYLFDVFWGVSPYLIGKSSTYLFATSIFIMAIPLILGVIAYLKNLPENEKEIKSVLDKHQLYNLELLILFIREKLNQGADLNNLKKELNKHGWDIALIELALKELKAQDMQNG